MSSRQPDLHSKFQDSQSYIIWPCLKKEREKDRQRARNRDTERQTRKETNRERERQRDCVHEHISKHSFEGKPVNAFLHGSSHSFPDSTL